MTMKGWRGNAFPRPFWCMPGLRYTGGAKKFCVTNIILRSIAPIRENSLPLNSLSL